MSVHMSIHTSVHMSIHMTRHTTGTCLYTFLCPCLHIAACVRVHAHACQCVRFIPARMATRTSIYTCPRTCLLYTSHMPIRMSMHMYTHMPVSIHMSTHNHKSVAPLRGYDLHSYGLRCTASGSVLAYIVMALGPPLRGYDLYSYGLRCTTSGLWPI